MALELLEKILIIIESDKTNIQMVLDDSIINFESKSLLSLVYEYYLSGRLNLSVIYEHYNLLESINTLLKMDESNLKIDSNKLYTLRDLKKLEFKLICLNDKDFDRQFKLA